MNKPEFVTPETKDFPKYYWEISRNPNTNVVSATAKSETNEEGYQFSLGLDLNSLGSHLSNTKFHSFPYIAIPVEFEKEIQLLKNAGVIENDWCFVTATGQGDIVEIYCLKKFVIDLILEYEAFDTEDWLTLIL